MNLPPQQRSVSQTSEKQFNERVPRIIKQHGTAAGAIFCCGYFILQRFNGVSDNRDSY